jgi:phosphoribosylglycinamide formyltransferase 1
MRKKIAIFASGSGSNAQRIFEYFKDSEQVEVACIVTNNSKAGVIERFRKNQYSRFDYQ